MATITNRKEIPKDGDVFRFGPALNWVMENKAILSLSCLAILNALVYGFIFIPLANLLALYQIPRLNLITLPQGGLPGLGRVILAFLVLGLAYWQGWRIAQNIQGKAAWAVVLGGSLVSSILLLFMYPFDASDIFDNILRGRILGVYGANPFLPVTIQFANDPFFNYSVWIGWPSAYGPGWEAFAGLVARLAGNGVLTNVLTFKALPGVSLLASLGLVAMILLEKAPQHALAGTLLLAWNPIVLYETWGNGHNDMTMVFWTLAAALALVHRRYTVGTLAMVAGALVKFIPFLLIPPIITLALSDLRLRRQRLTFLAVTAVLSILLIFFAYGPFWSGIEVLNVQGRTRLYTSTLPSTIYYLLLNLGWSKAKATAIVSQVAFSLTIAFTLWKSCKVWKTPSFDETTQAAVQILLFYLLVTCLWFQNWYSLWTAGLAALLRPGPTRRLALLIGFATLSKPLGIGPMLFWSNARLTQPWLEFWFTLGVLGLPWIYWLFSTWETKHDR